MSHDPKRWPLGEALAMAEKIQRSLAPYCREIAIAGSIRRLRPDIGDIDLVLEPRPDCREAILERCLRRGHKEADGRDYTRLHVMVPPHADPIQLDLWWVRPPSGDFFTESRTNWGMRLLIATGSAQHNMELAKRAKLRGQHLAPYRGIEGEGRYEMKPVAGGLRELYQGGRVIASATEEEIFAALDLPWIVPEKREARP